MDARMFTIPAAAPRQSEKTYILYWNTGLNQYDPVEFLNRSKQALLEIRDDCIHRTLSGIARAEPVRKKQGMNGFPYILELDLPLGKTVALMREKKFADFAARVKCIHPIYALEGLSNLHNSVSVNFADDKFCIVRKPAALKR
jgi:hypothetical protein